MDKDETIGEIVGCDNLYAAKVLEDSENAFRTDTPFHLAPLGEVKHDPKVSSDSSYYDNKKMFTYYSGAPEVSLTVSGVSEKLKSELSGQPYDTKTGRAYDTGDYSNTPNYALGFRVSLGNNLYLYRWFYKGTFGLGAITAKTKADKISATGYELTYSPLATVHQWDVADPNRSENTIKTSMSGTSADTSDPAFTGESDWFSTVQTPETSAIEALTVTSNPENNATGVAAAVKPALTFNNTIADYSGVMLLGNSGIAAATVTADASGKVLTVAPAAALTAGATYSIVLSGVTDIYGQKLANQTVTFTVAAA